MEKLRDIKDIVAVPDHSLALFSGLIVLILLLTGAGFYLFKNRRRRRKKLTAKEIALRKLKSIDYSSAKEVVYTFEAETEQFLNERNHEAFNSIKKELERYKYKRDVPELTDGIKEKIKAFIKGLK